MLLCKIFTMQIKTMKETYLPELKEMYQKIATKLQLVNVPFFYISLKLYA